MLYNTLKAVFLYCNTFVYSQQECLTPVWINGGGAHGGSTQPVYMLYNTFKVVYIFVHSQRESLTLFGSMEVVLMVDQHSWYVLHYIENSFYLLIFTARIFNPCSD